MKKAAKFEKRLSIMVPAYNEEANLADAIDEITSGVKGKVTDYEIIIVDDGSKDKTGKIADNLTKKDKHIQVIHNHPNQGLGYNYRKGLELAKFEYYMYIPGDNQLPSLALKLILDHIGRADIVIPYVTNMNIRPLPRQIISYTFTQLVNILFSQKVTYYNGTVVHRTDLLRYAPPQTNGFAYQVEALIRVLSGGASYIEVGYEMVERAHGKTAAFKLKNIKRVTGLLWSLFWEIHSPKGHLVSEKIRKAI